MYTLNFNISAQFGGEIGEEQTQKNEKHQPENNFFGAEKLRPPKDTFKTLTKYKSHISIS